MMSALGPEDVAAWVERNLSLATGEPLELAPWQESALRALYTGERIRFPARRVHRSSDDALAAAAAALCGERVSATDAALARALYDRAVAEVVPSVSDAHVD